MFTTVTIRCEIEKNIQGKHHKKIISNPGSRVIFPDIPGPKKHGNHPFLQNISIFILTSFIKFTVPCKKFHFLKRI